MFHKLNASQELLNVMHDHDHISKLLQHSKLQWDLGVFRDCVVLLLMFIWWFTTNPKYCILKQKWSQSQVIYHQLDCYLHVPRLSPAQNFIVSVHFRIALLFVCITNYGTNFTVTPLNFYCTFVDYSCLRYEVSLREGGLLPIRAHN